MRRVKTEHDVVFGNAGAFEIIGNDKIGIVSLNPYFAVDDFQMNDELMNALTTILADRDYRIAVGIGVKNGFMRSLFILGNVENAFLTWL